MPSVAEIMTQVGVFASAWSLIGGPFDAGDQAANAETEKKLLHDMLQQYESSADADILPILSEIQNWHSAKFEHLAAIREKVSGGVVIQLRETSGPSRVDVVLTEREAAIFKMGFDAAKDSFKELPFCIQSTEQPSG